MGHRVPQKLENRVNGDHSPRLRYSSSPRTDCPALSFQRLNWHSLSYKGCYNDDDDGNDHNNDADWWLWTILAAFPATADWESLKEWNMILVKRISHSDSFVFLCGERYFGQFSCLRNLPRRLIFQVLVSAAQTLKQFLEVCPPAILRRSSTRCLLLLWGKWKWSSNFLLEIFSKTFPWSMTWEL